LAQSDDRKEDEEEENKEGAVDSSLPSGYPETVEFSGIGNASLLQVHISAALIILVGIIIAIEVSPAGLFLLLVFLVLVLLIEAWMFRRSTKKLRIRLYLRENPVEAFSGNYRVGVIDHGTIEPGMDNLNELGYRPAPKKDLIVWTFDSAEDKEIAQRRLLEYLPKDDDDSS